MVRAMTGTWIVLVRYGAALGGAELVTAVWAWSFAPGLAPDVPAVCWPILQSCESFRVLGPLGLRLWVIAFGALGVAAAVLFLAGRVRAGYVTLAAATLLKLLFVLLDFRLRRNQHYMALSTTLCFLLWPNKRDSLRVLLVAFYFWAGTLKLNGEWLSGSTLYRPLWFFEGPWLAAACAYVVALELVLVWGILARNGWLFWGTLAQLALFHLFSYPVVGFFYPVLMMLLLLIHPLAHWDPRADRPSLLARFASGRAPRPAYALFLGFAALQLLPRLLPGDNALTGEGRFLMVHMFDSRPECRAEIWVRADDGRRARAPLADGLGTRIHCDPWVLFAQAHQICALVEAQGGPFVDVDMRMESKRSTEDRYRLLVDERDVCSRKLRYDWWRHNEWIRTGDGAG
jgi:hypothetical protein